jgi:hypothetical protein
MPANTMSVELAGATVELRAPIEPRKVLVSYWYGQHHDALSSGEIPTPLAWAFSLACAASIGLCWPDQEPWPSIAKAGWDLEVYGEGVLAELMDRGASATDVTRAGRGVLWWLLGQLHSDAELEEALDPTDAQGATSTAQP